MNINKVILTALLSTIFSAILNSPVIANQVSNCTLISGSKSENYEKPISVNNQIELSFSKAYLSTEEERKMSCDLLSFNTDTWIGRIGIPDESKISVAQVSIYLDDEFQTTTTIFKGEIIELKVDLNKHKNITWQYQINVGEADYIYFLQWGFFALL
ncbi:MAG TPA: hypothetical protein VE956_02580 [Nodularia sp. (in: cyanobacteria)]|nr:hypothetical protein [Nodularia sp. (in: cyanobacteria)]